MMPKIPLSYQQYRCVIGNHTNWLDRKQKSQKYQNDHIQCLALTPGRHAKNLHRQNTALAALQLFSLLSSVRNCRTYPAVTRQRAHDLYLNNRFQEMDRYFHVNTPELFQSQDMNKGRGIYRRDSSCARDEISIINIVACTLHSMKNVIAETDKFIVRFDPLKFPSVQGFQENPLIKFDIDNNSIDFNRYYYQEITKNTGYGFIDAARNSLSDYFDNYSVKYPSLKLLARSVLKEKIQTRFHLELNPDIVRFMLFDNVMYEGGEKVHYSPACENRTLTEWLFTNFNAEIQDRLPDMDAMCGIYMASMNKKVYHGADEIKIKPTDFIRLVYDIDFYNYARNKLTESFSDSDAHIKKYFIDFINHLAISGITHESAKDVLTGVGLLKNKNVNVFLFDINQYKAANAFVFRNNAGPVTLYFPQSDFKFIVFRSNVEMQSWATKACSTQKHREMIASHFSIANRQDGIFYYGVDAWLNFIHKNSDYSYVIALSQDVIPKEHFFDYVLMGIKDKAFSDLDVLIKSDAELRRDEWEKMIDASNIIPNPISPFLSLAMHLEHAIKADRYEEKQQEWNKIKYDAVNIVTMLVLKAEIKFPELEGYDFIDIVNDKIKATRLEETDGILKTPVFSDNFYAMERDLGSSSQNWAFDDDDEQIEHNIIQYREPLENFFPLRETIIENNVVKIESEIRDYMSHFFDGHPHDIFYGFVDEDWVPQYIRNKRAVTKMHLEGAKNDIDKAYYRLTHPDYENVIKKYISKSLGSRDEHIITEAIKRLTLQVRRSQKFFEESEKRQFINIGIVSSRQIAKPGNPFEFDSAIDPSQREIIPFGVTHMRDPFRRIFIFNDALPDVTPNLHNEFGEQFYNILDSVILHEVSHSAAKTGDYYYGRVDVTKSRLGSARKLLKQFNKGLVNGSLKNTISFRHFMKSAYRHLGINQVFDKNMALAMLQRDPMMKANMMLDNADNFVVYIKDIITLNRAGRSKRGVKDSISKMKYLRSIFGASHHHFIKYPHFQ